MSLIVLMLILLLTACAEGRWVQPGKTDVQVNQDWEACKSEVLSGQEHQKETLAGGINLSGCMHSRGYTYVEDQQPGGHATEAVPSR